jgi:hypothetical protein
MSRAPSTFRETDVKRALRATRAAGMEVLRWEVGRDGRIVVVTSTNSENTSIKGKEPVPADDWSDAT